MLMSRFTFATEPKSSAADRGRKMGSRSRRQRARAKARMMRDEKAGSSYTYRGRYRGNRDTARSVGGTTARAGRAEEACRGPPRSPPASPDRRSESEDREAGRFGSDSPSLRATL